MSEQETLAQLFYRQAGGMYPDTQTFFGVLRGYEHRWAPSKDVTFIKFPDGSKVSLEEQAFQVHLFEKPKYMDEDPPPVLPESKDELKAEVVELAKTIKAADRDLDDAEAEAKRYKTERDTALDKLAGMREVRAGLEKRLQSALATIKIKNEEVDTAMSERADALETVEMLKAERDKLAAPTAIAEALAERDAAQSKCGKLDDALTMANRQLEGFGRAQEAVVELQAEANRLRKQRARLHARIKRLTLGLAVNVGIAKEYLEEHVEHHYGSSFKTGAE